MSPRKQKSVTVPIRIGIDTGGTFTDFVASRGSLLSTFKVPSTPHNPAEAILSGISRILADSDTEPFEIVHGTTVATNALLERKGARTALITTKGFEDVIEIGRQARPDLYNLMVTRPSPLVSRELRFGLEERTGPTGQIITPLAEDSIARLVKLISNHNPRLESAAVCLLFSFANPAHEEAIATKLEPLGIPVSQSHKILPEYREYERTSTVVINAYLVPLMSRYLNALGEGLSSVANRRNPRVNSKLEARQSSPQALLVMQSNGGSVSASTASAEPVRAILSGPAGGVVGALRVCSVAGIKDIITFDMGGTSTDVALCRGEARTTNEAVVAGLPVAVPVIDIHTVGAGGGSIARVDAAGALRVGPESAGADPGPACYGRGNEVTVTDANLVLGRFGGASLLGGEMPIDLNRARTVLSRLANEISRFTKKPTTAQQAALGVVRVANANMEAALRVVSIERGQDPRLFTLVSFGGAGGLHVCELAASLRIPRVVVPKSPGTLSALGVLLGDVVKDYSRTVMMKTGELDMKALEKTFVELEQKGILDLKDEGFDKDRLRLKRSVALRYAGQSFEIDIPWSKNFGARFHASHRERYGYADSSRPIEVVSLRVRAAGITQKPAIAREHRTRTPRLIASHVTPAYLNERQTKVPVYRREQLKTGMRFRGPAVVTEYSSTTLITAAFRASVDPWLNLIVETI
ncbi:MAG TPA: hydantoinase/oxoprolinase family protein [Blastocatellia bacterium]|nr:hydantoinase/oxoprolinase family protein [Blastocatellia bacterium]